MNVTRFARRRGFTLVELLVVCAIVAVLLSMVLFALRGAAEQARIDRTRAQINKINDLLMTRWEGYRQRPLPYRIPSGTQPQTAAVYRLEVTWELMRMELPERIADVRDPNVKYGLQPALWRSYRSKLVALTGSTPADPTANWTSRYVGAECLYLILSTIRDGDSTALDFFSPNEIKDLDGDGVPEILDGWGRPLGFFRWAPGFTKSNGMPSSIQTGNAAEQPDPFDPLGIYRNANHFALFPLVYSAGPDGRFETDTDGNEYVWGYGLEPGNVQYAGDAMTPQKDPWATMATGPVGGPCDAALMPDEFSKKTWEDNITNHLQVVR